MSRANFVRRFSMGFGILIIISLIVSVYFYFYVARQEDKMNARNFRVLQQTGKKLEQRIKDYKQLANAEMSAGKSAKPDHPHQFEIDSMADTAGKIRPEWEISNGRISFFIRGKKLYILRMDFNKILSPLLRYDVFDAYTLHKDKIILCNSLEGLCQFPKTDTMYQNDGCRDLLIGKNKHRQFFHPFSVANGTTYMLSGFMDPEHYTHNKYGVSGSFLLNILIVMLLVLLAFPFIKSLLMAPEETLENRDILLSVLSLFLFCYLYIFFHRQAYTSWTFNNKQADHMLDSSSRHISGSFVNELKAAYRQLDVFDTFYNKLKPLQKNIYLKESSIRVMPLVYTDCKRAYWINKDGSPAHEWAFDGETSQVDNYSERGYFKSALHHDLWFMDGDTSKKFCLEPIFSWNDGSFRAAIAKPSINNKQVAAVTSNMVSVINTIQPREINYCIIDKKGNTLFNSLGNNHFDENFMEECGNPLELRSAMNSRLPISIEVHYLGEYYRMMVKPVKGLPLFIATFTEKSASDNSQLHIFIFATLFIVTILIGFCLTITLSILLRKRPKDQMTSFWDISWLYPRKRFELRDLAGICTNFIILAALIAASVALRNYPVSQFVLFFTTAVGTTAGFCFARAELQKAQRIIFISMLAGIFLFADIFAAYINGWETFRTICVLVLYQVLLIFILLYVEKPERVIIKKLHALLFDPLRKTWIPFRKIKFYNQYAFLLVTWFILIVAVPCHTMYGVFHKQERESLVKRSQLGLAQQLYSKVHYKGPKKFPAFYIRESRNKTSGADYTNMYMNDYQQTSIRFDHTSPMPDSQTQEQRVLDGTLDMARMALGTKTGLGTVLSGKNEEAVRFSMQPEKLTLVYKNMEKQKSGVLIPNTCVIRSTVPRLSNPDLVDENGMNPLFILYFLSPFVFIFLLYRFILYFIKRYFLFEFFPQTSPGDNVFDEYVKKLENPNGESLKLFIVGLPNSGKNQIISDAIERLKNRDSIKVHEVDMASLEITTAPATQGQQTPEAAQKQVALRNNVGDDIRQNDFTQKDLFIFRHFEHDLSDEKTTSYKFELIAELFQKPVRPHIVILSIVHPSVFLNNLKAKVVKKPDIEDTFRAEDYINQQEYYNWTGLLSGFNIFMQPLKATNNNQATSPQELKKVYYSRYRGKYLYYLSLWNALERLEKFVLYDLAKDHLANCRNELALYSLHSKGIIHNTDMPDITDINFRNFIICEIKESEVEAERVQTKSSAWSKFKTPFLITISIVLFIIFVTQQESFNKIIALIGVFSTGASVLLKVFGTGQSKP